MILSFLSSLLGTHNLLLHLVCCLFIHPFSFFIWFSSLPTTSFLPALFFLFRATPMTYRGSHSCSCWPTPQPQQKWIPATSATYTAAHSSARALTRWVRPGIIPACSWMLVRFVTTEPQGNYPSTSFPFPSFCPSLSLHFHFLFCLFRAEPTAYGGSQARVRIGAAAASLHNSHSNAGSKLHLRPTPQLTARDWTCICMDTSRIHFCWAMMGTPISIFYSKV